MSEFLDWSPEHADAVLAWAIERLGRGELVAFPTETVYSVAASALDADAVEKLAQLGGEPVALALTHPLELADWAPRLAGVGKRLARQCWPGPLILEAPTAGGLFDKLPGATRNVLARDGRVPLRMPGHPALLQTGRLFGQPLLVREIAGATGALQLLPLIGDAVALVLQDGPTAYGATCSMVRVEGPIWALAKPGLLMQEALAELARCTILFVCTGNTCRSPLAMALCRRLLADRLGCPADELPGHGFQVLSAGLAAAVGAVASPEAVEVAREMGADLTQHCSQPVTAELLARADFLFTMTSSHLRILSSLDVPLGAEPRLFAPHGDDVADPLGGSMDVYQACAQDMRAYLEHWVPEILEA